MIQTKTLAVDTNLRTTLLSLSRMIEQNRNNPERVRSLIAEHDEIIKRLVMKLYDPQEESKWA